MIIAVDIGGTKTLVAQFDAAGSIVREQKFATPGDYDEFCQSLLATIHEIAPTTSDENGETSNTIEAISVAAPGLIDYERGVALEFGNLGWHDAPLKQFLEKHFANTPVILDNDANFGGLGEAVLGAGQGYDTALYVTVSTGIGTGVTYKGMIEPALRHSEGGMQHFMHDGKLMLWEHFASGKAFYERYKQFGKDVDDPAIWQEYARDLSLGFGGLIAIIQPDIVVIGGSMGVHLAKYHDFLAGDIEATKSSVITMPKIVAAHNPERAVVFGCFVAGQQALEHAKSEAA